MENTSPTDDIVLSTLLKMSNVEPSKSTMTKFYEVEIQKIFDGMLSIQNLRVQLGTFFGTVTVGIMTAAFSTQKAGILLAGSVLLILYWMLDLIAINNAIRFYYRALQLQIKFAPEDKSSFLSVFIGYAWRKKIENILKIPGLEDAHKSLRKIPISTPAFTGFWLPLLASSIEASLGITLWIVYNWQLF